jgi:diguanylate cyclase (GGDEF)-like protein
MTTEELIQPVSSLHQDPLSGLVSRIGLESYLESYGKLNSEKKLTLMVVELSRFGSVNESMGAELGNKIIKTISRRLIKIFSNATLIARTHGNHFCLLFEDKINIDDKVELLNDFTQRPLALGGEVIVLTVCTGIAELGALIDSPAYLLNAAEVALHRAKRDGLKHCFYQTHFVSDAKAVHQLENDLRISLVTNHAELHQAIINDEFKIVYQPIVDARTHQVHALEALMRWHHPKRGIISPALFIPMAEQIQLMDVLGSWIIRRGCMDTMSFPANKDGSRPGVSINVSGTQFLNPEILIQSVQQALNESGLEPHRLKLEITESTAFGMKKIDIVNKLRNMGCMIALDDFGTGFSSLTQLIATPIDYLKLDTSFIRAIGSENSLEDLRSDQLTRAVLSIAKEFNFSPIVEGVETAIQCERLIEYGASLIQGYYFSKPLPLEEACKFIVEFNDQKR